MEINQTNIQELVSKLTESGITTITVQHNPETSVYRIVTLGFVIIVVGGEGEPLVQVSPTQFTCNSTKGVVSGINAALKIFPILIASGITDVVFDYPVYVVFDKEGEVLDVILGEEAEARIAEATVAQNYDKEKLKTLADKAIAEGIKDKVVSKAKQILTDPSGNTSTKKVLVSTKGQRLTKRPKGAK